MHVARRRGGEPADRLAGAVEERLGPTVAILLTVLNGFGIDNDRNVTAGGALSVQVGRLRFAPEVRLLDVEEAAAALAAYERRNRIVAPVIRRVLSRLAGFRYDGRPEARLRLVQALPLVGFRPRG